MAAVTYVGTQGLAGDVLGANLITNGHFTDDTTGWTAQNSSTIAKTPDGYLRVTNGGGFAGWGSVGPITVTTGTTYRVSANIRIGTASAALLFASTNATSGDILQSTTYSADGSDVFYFTAPGTTVYLLTKNVSTTTGHYSDFDDVTLKEVTTRGHATDIEHVTNGTVSVNSQWTLGTGITVAGSGRLAWDGTQNPSASNAYQQNAAPAHGVRYGKVYDCGLTVASYTAGLVGFVLGANGSTTKYSATFTDQVTATTINGTTHNPGIFVQGNATFVGEVDNISVTLAADNTWSLDIVLAHNGLSPGRAEDVRRRFTMDGSPDTLYLHSKKILQCTTTRLAYGTWQFFEEFADSAMDGQTITFDPYGTVDNPVAPASYILTGWTLNRVFNSGVNEVRQYSFTVREI